jgi:hypothetical protein
MHGGEAEAQVRLLEFFRVLEYAALAARGSPTSPRAYAAGRE